MRVAVCSRSFSKNSFLRKELQNRYLEVKFNDQGVSLNEDGLRSFISDFDAAIIGLEEINSNLLSALPKLKVIGKYGVGLDKIDLQACSDYGVRIGWQPGVNSVAVAELALNMAITIVRKTAVSNSLVKTGAWEQIIGKQLSSLTVGVMGCGHVGSEFVKLLSGFSCSVLVFDKRDVSDFCSANGAEQVCFNEILSRSDLISIHLPKDVSTEGLLCREVVEGLKFGSYIVNTARGGLLNEAHLYECLNNGKLSGVALDVLSVEPPVDSMLINHPNCYITSHIGGSSEEAIIAMGLAAIDGLQNNQLASDFF